MLPSALVFVSANVPASVSHAETAGATPGSGRGAAAVIDAGSFHSCALLENGTVKCWGYGFEGQLGQGDKNARGDGPGEMGNNLTPVSLGAGRTATAIAAGGYHSCALLDDGTVKCWGANVQGQLGQGDTSNRGDGPGEMGGFLAPVDLGTGRTATAITAGGAPFVRSARRRHRQVLGSQCLGAARPGRQERPGRRPGRDGRLPAAPSTSVPAAPPPRSPPAGSHSCALLDDGTVKCWGCNVHGRARPGRHRTTAATARARWATPWAASTSVPAAPPPRSPPAVATSCALLDNGTVKCWGRNVYGQLGQGDDHRPGRRPR